MSEPTPYPAWLLRAMPPENVLTAEDAEPILAEWADGDPFLCLALAWQQAAAVLAAEDPSGGVGGGVSSVNTGAQSVSYSPPRAVGAAGAATERSNYFRTRAKLRSVPSAPFVARTAWDRLGMRPEHPVPIGREASSEPVYRDVREAATRAGFPDAAISEAVGYPVFTDVFPAVRTSRTPPAPTWRPIDEPVGRAVGQLIEEQATGVELPEAAPESVAPVQYATPEAAVVDGAR